jgi:hypothetical protein
LILIIFADHMLVEVYQLLVFQTDRGQNIKGTRLCGGTIQHMTRQGVGGAKKSRKHVKRNTEPNLGISRQ